MTRFKMTLYFRIFSALLLVVACTPKKPVTELSAGRVSRGDLVQRVTASGFVIPNRKAVIVAPYRGYVHKIFVELGQQIKKDTPIVSFSQSLRSDDQESYPLRAQFGGTVTQVLKTEGEWVDEGGKDSVLRIDDLSKLFIESTVPETDIGKIKKDQEVSIKISSADSIAYKGIIRDISLAAAEKNSDNSRTRVEFLIKIEILNPDNRIKPGMSTIIDVITEKRSNVLILRHEFIHKEANDSFLVNAKGQRQILKLGLQNEEAAEILSGASEGDSAEPVDFLKLTPET